MSLAPSLLADAAWGSEVSLDLGFEFRNVTVRVGFMSTRSPGLWASWSLKRIL